MVKFWILILILNGPVMSHRHVVTGLLSYKHCLYIATNAFKVMHMTGRASCIRVDEETSTKL